ncbi:hypothetical protein MRX96_007468 [Rhipicephalus microplus]
MTSASSAVSVCAALGLPPRCAGFARVVTMVASLAARWPPPSGGRRREIKEAVARRFRAYFRRFAASRGGTPSSAPRWALCQFRGRPPFPLPPPSEFQRLA